MAPEASSIEEAPLRIVGLVPSLNELAIAIGASHHIAARTDYDTHAALAERPSIGGGLDPNFERVVALGIDVVMVSEGRDTPALTSRFNDLGVEVLELPTQTIADIHGSIGKIGALLGRTAQADSLSASIRRELSDIQERVAGRRPIPVMFVVWPDPPMTASSGTFINEVISVAGGANVFEDAALPWPTIGFEPIVAREPEMVIWPQGEITIANVDVLKSTPGWRDVAAVQDGRVVLVDSSIFNRPGPRIAEAARLLAEALHPEVF